MMIVTPEQDALVMSWTVLQKCLDVRHPNLSFRSEALQEALDGPRRP